MELNKLYDCAEINSGLFGTVYSLNDLNLAVKLIKLKDISLVELDIMSRLRHKNIMQILDFGIFEITKDQIKKVEFNKDGVYFGFVMEKAVESLYYYEPKNKQETLHIIEEMISSLSFLHSNKIIHGDIKPDNFLVFENGTDSVNIKLTDFGGSKYSPSGKNKNTIYGSIGYRSIEMLLDHSIVDYTVDYWALGCSIYYIVTRKEPVKEIRKYSNNYKEIFPYMTQNELYDIIEKEFTYFAESKVGTRNGLAGFPEIIDITKKLLLMYNRKELKLENKTIGYSLSCHNNLQNNNTILKLDFFKNLKNDIPYDIILKALQLFILTYEKENDISYNIMLKYFDNDIELDFNQLYNKLNKCNGIINNYSLYDTPFRNIEKIESLDDYNFIFKYFLQI